MSHKPGHFDDELKRLDKKAGIPVTSQPAGVESTGRQVGPVMPRKYDPKIWEKYKTAQGFMKWRKKRKPQRLIPRHETKKKGTISGRYGAQ